MGDVLAEIAPFAQISAAGVLLAVVWYILRIITRGDVVPKPTVDMLLAGRDAEIIRANERADGYRDLAETERHSREIVTEQNRELIEVARTVEHAFEAMRLVAEGRAPHDVAD